MHFFLSIPALTVLTEKQSQGISRPGDRRGVGTAFTKQICHLKTTRSELWYFTEGQGLKPGHILTNPFALQPQRWGWKELNVRQAGWGASVTHPPTQMSVCKGAKIISWTGALQSQGDLPFLSLLHPFAFSSFVLHTQPSPSSKEWLQSSEPKMFAVFNSTVNHKSQQG